MPEHFFTGLDSKFWHALKHEVTMSEMPLSPVAAHLFDFGVPSSTQGCFQGVLWPLKLIWLMADQLASGVRLLIGRSYR